MNQDKYEIVKMAREAGVKDNGIATRWFEEWAVLEKFATLCRAPLVAEVERLTADLEQTRVQLAGCGVAAMQNTEESKAHRVERGAYGWSESYGDVCRTVDSEIELRAENARLKDDYQHACKTVAENAALKQAHEINADTLNAMQVEIDDWKARALAASERETCTWTEQDDKDMPGTYESSCGEMWSFIDGGVKENRIIYCHHCGGKVAIAAGQQYLKENGK